MNDAQLLIDQLQGQANDCQQQWQTLAAWHAKNASYQAQLANAAKSKGKTKAPASANPGPQPSRARSGELRAGRGVRHPGSPRRHVDHGGRSDDDADREAVQPPSRPRTPKVFGQRDRYPARRPGEQHDDALSGAGRPAAGRGSRPAAGPPSCG